jgi:predicted dehydrogenase
VRAHLPALKAMPDVYEVIAVCTTRMETANTAAKHFGVPHAFDSVERMLRELPEIDVVCVSVRPVFHHEVVMQALRADGLGTADHSAIACYYEKLAKVEVAR